MLNDSRTINTRRLSDLLTARIDCLHDGWFDWTDVTWARKTYKGMLPGQWVDRQKRERCKSRRSRRELSTRTVARSIPGHRLRGEEIPGEMSCINANRTQDSMHGTCIVERTLVFQGNYLRGKSIRSAISMYVVGENMKPYCCIEPTRVQSRM